MKRASATRPRTVPKVESPANHLFLNFAFEAGADGQRPRNRGFNVLTGAHTCGVTYPYLVEVRPPRLGEALTPVG